MKHGVRLDRETRAELAREAFALHERGEDRTSIAVTLDLSVPTVRNLILYGARLARGEEPKMEWGG